MIFLRLKEEEDYYRITLIHYRPFDQKYGLKKTYEQLFLEGVLVEELPKYPEPKENYTYQLRANLQTKELYYEEIFVAQ